MITSGLLSNMKEKPATPEPMRALRIGQLAAVAQIWYSSDPNLASHGSSLLEPRIAIHTFATMIAITL